MLAQRTSPNAGPASISAQIIHQEKQWFEVSAAEALASSQPRILPSRWVGHAEASVEHQAVIAADHHVIGIALRAVDDVTIFAARRLVQSGPLPAGSVRVNEPGVPLRGIFSGSYDTLHLRIPNTMLAQYTPEQAEDGFCRRRVASIHTGRPVVDPVIVRLAWALNRAEELGGSYGRSYADGISLAITARMLGTTEDYSPKNPRVSALCKWRLKRATEFMSAHLSEPISLTDIAAAAGLSRMHFAAQFRAATGLRPHEYLLQRRIERARYLLLTSRLPLIEIAFEVGFKTQAHFTTVFSRIVGEAPNAWRQHSRCSAAVTMPRAA